MKKVILAIGVVVSLASCGGNTTNTNETKTDSTKINVDSTKNAVDTTKVDTTAVK
jgi:hypothetical protein